MPVATGESATDIHPVLSKLRKAGVGGILDYAAESDLPSAQHRQISRPHASAVAEAELDRNLDVTIRAVEAAASVSGSAAVKVKDQWVLVEYLVFIRN